MVFLDHKYLDLVFTIFPLMDEETEAPRWKVTSLRSMGTQPMPMGAPIPTSDLLWMTRPPSPVMPCPWSQSLAHGQCLMSTWSMPDEPILGMQGGTPSQGERPTVLQEWFTNILVPVAWTSCRVSPEPRPGADCLKRPFSKTSSQTSNQDDSWEPWRPPGGGDPETGTLVGEGEGRVAWPRRQAAGA